MPTEFVRERNDLCIFARILAPAIVENYRRSQQYLLPAPVDDEGVAEEQKNRVYEVPRARKKYDERPVWAKDPRFLKVESYTTKEEFVREVSRAIIENMKGAEKDRIVPYDLVFSADGTPNFLYENKSRLGEAEFTGMMNMRQLALNGEKYILWLSVPGGRSTYTEGRLIVGVVKDVEDKVVIDCRGIPVLRSAGVMKKMADKLVKELGAQHLGKLEMAEDLREQPLGLKCKDDAEFWNKCQEIFGVKEVWEAIKQGKDIKVREAIEVWLGEIWDEMQRELRGRKITSREESIKWGKFVEDRMRQRGIVVVGGNHGDTNGSTAFNGLYSMNEIGLQISKKEGKWVCPCGEVLVEGTKVCPKCGLQVVLME